MAGSKVYIWKQDPSVTTVGIGSVYLYHDDITSGPKDKDIEIHGIPDVAPNINGDFLYDPKQNPLEFDAVHTYAVVRQVFNMYERALRRMNVIDDLDWQWGDAPIKVFPRAGYDANAYYSRGERALRFFYFHPNNDDSRPLVFTCRSFDIVAHETGHAVLDALRPGYWASTHPETGGLHEAIGDLTAIFLMLAKLDLCEAIIAESKGDLHAPSFFSSMAEQFGNALGRAEGLRNANNDLTMSQVTEQVHDLSKVFTGAVYDILVEMYESANDPTRYDQAETLFRVGKHLTSIVIASLLTGPSENATYSDIAEKMLQFEHDGNWKALIKRIFTEREVLGSSAVTITAKLKPSSFNHCCGAMQHREHIESVITEED